MSSTLVTPLLISVPFGVGASNPTYINLPIPVPSQISTTVNAASFTDGFPPSTMTPEASGGLPFFGQDMNGILYMVSAYCANFAAGALSAYNSTLSSAISGYPVGVVLVNTNGNGLWVNQTSGNTTDPDTGGAGWLPLCASGGVAVALASSNVTLSALQSAYPFIALVGTLTANLNVIFPVNTGQQWIVANGTSGSFTVTVKTASGSGVIVPQTGDAAPTSIYCDGTNIQNTGVSTAGLAPIASPALTGTPTAPTATPSTTNTTQIATTAFVQAALTAALALYAKLASPVFSGVPTAPTPASSDNSLKLATTAFVQTAVGAIPLIRAGNTGSLATGSHTVNFSPAFPNACTAVTLTVRGTSATYALTGSSRTGFTFNTGNTTTYDYIAVGS